MHPIEFTVELTGESAVTIPDDVAAQLPKTGRARVIILPAADSSDAEWRRAAYEQFLRDDAAEDAIYDTYK